VLIERVARQLPVKPMLNDGLLSKAADNYRILRSRGVIIRNTVDIIIGTFCIEEKPHPPSQ
jgi:hypothetical protein